VIAAKFDMGQELGKAMICEGKGVILINEAKNRQTCSDPPFQHPQGQHTTVSKNIEARLEIPPQH
jgi:hypothetical protein